MAHAGALHRAGRPREAVDAFHDALSTLPPSDVDRVATVMTLLSSAYIELGDPRTAEAARQAVELLEGRPTPAFIDACVRWAGTCLTLDDPRTALDAAENAMRVAAAQGVAKPLRAMEMCAFARCALGDVPGGLADCDMLIDLLATDDSALESLATYLSLSEIMLVYRGPAKARELKRRGRRLAERRHDTTIATTFRVGELEDLIFLGQWGSVAAGLDELAVSLQASGRVFDLADVRDLSMLLATMSGAMVGDVDDWLAEDRGGVYGSPSLHLLAAALRCEAQGSDSEALRLLERLGDAGSTFCSIPSLMLWWPHGIRASLRAGAVELAVKLARQLNEAPPAPVHAKVTAAALQAEAAAELQRAVPLYAEAVDLWGAFGAPYEQAQALLGQGRCHMRLGEAREAARALEEARGMFRRLGADPVLLRPNACSWKPAAPSSDSCPPR